MNLRRFFGIGTLLLLAIVSMVLAQEPAAPPPTTTPAAGTANDPVRLNVAVDLVNISATVRDSSGRYVSGLTQGNFTVMENGVEQKLSFFNHDVQMNLSVGVMVDTSGSMRHKLKQAEEEVRGDSVARMGRAQ